MLDEEYKPTMICLPKLGYKYTSVHIKRPIIGSEWSKLEEDLEKLGYKSTIDMHDGDWFCSNPKSFCLGLFTEDTQHNFFQKGNMLVYLFYENIAIGNSFHKINPILVGPRKELIHTTLHELLPAFKPHYLRSPLTLDECYERCQSEEIILWQTEESLKSNERYLTNLEEMLFELQYSSKKKEGNKDKPQEISEQKLELNKE